MVLQKLTEKGYKLQELSLEASLYEEITEILAAAFTNDGGSKERNIHMKGEKQLPAYEMTEAIGKLKYYFMKILIKFLGEQRSSSVLKGILDRKANEIFKLNAQLERI